MRSSLRCVLVSSWLAGAQLGCPAPAAKPNVGTPDAHADSHATEAAAPPVELPKIEGPVAKVDGREIPAADFLSDYTRLVGGYQRAGREISPAFRERLKDKLVERLIDGAIIEQHAEKLGIKVTEAEVETAFEQRGKQYGSEQAFKQFLERDQMSEVFFKKRLGEELLRSKVRDKLGEGVQPTEAEVRQFYDKTIDAFRLPEQVRASHILLKVARGAAPEERAKRKREAETLLAQAKAKGADFAVLASQHGEDSTKSRGGDLGFFARGRMVRAFEEAAWKLKVGEIALVETDFGFHLVKKTDAQPARVRPFEEIKSQVEANLLGRKRAEAVNQTLSEWRKAAQVEVFLKGDQKIIEEADRQSPSAVTPGTLNEATPPPANPH